MEFVHYLVMIEFVSTIHGMNNMKVKCMLTQQ